MAYAIYNWSDYYESSYAKRIKGALSWVPVPTSHDGKRLARVAGHPECTRIFGAWCLILQIGAKCPTRGVLVDDRGHALTGEDMQDMTGFPAVDFELAIQVLSDPRIGWIIGEGETLIDQTAKASAEDSSTEDKPPRTERRAIRWDTVAGFTDITDTDRQRWSEAYPACDLDRQLAAMDDWLHANPSKARKSNWAKFITNWLTRSQDRGGDAASNRPAKQPQLSAAKASANRNIDPRNLVI